MRKKAPPPPSTCLPFLPLTHAVSNFFKLQNLWDLYEQTRKKMYLFQAKYPKRYFKQLNLSEENPIHLFQKTYSHHLKTAIYCLE